MKEGMPSTKLIWSCVLGFRWITLAHILVMLVLGATKAVPSQVSWILLLSAVAFNIAVSFSWKTIFENRSYWLPFLTIDLIVCGLLQSFGGGWRSAWYLYSTSPILAAALFYHLRGSILTAAVSGMLYSASIIANGSALWKQLMANNLDDLISNLFSYLLIGFFFAYPCVLFDRLSKTRMELAQAHRNLESSRKQLSLLYRMSPLTRREIQVLKLLAGSKSNREIATELYISEETVKSHVKNIFKKLNLKSRTEAANYFWQHG